jgi:hypothetical protein
MLTNLNMSNRSCFLALLESDISIKFDLHHSKSDAIEKSHYDPSLISLWILDDLVVILNTQL